MVEKCITEQEDLNMIHNTNKADIAEIDFKSENDKCTQGTECQTRLVSGTNLYDRYLGYPNSFPPPIISACLNISCASTYEEYYRQVKKVSKGTAMRQSNKSDRNNFYCHTFDKKTFLPDFVEINTSKEVRCGGPMRPNYRKSVEDLGGFPTSFVKPQEPQCALHYNQMWGIFSAKEGYKQGDVVTNEKLLGYINFIRVGNLGWYGTILGHGAYLKYGIMYNLHFNIMKWIYDNSKYTQGIEYILYAGWENGRGPGLQQWKKKLLWAPFYMVNLKNERVSETC